MDAPTPSRNPNISVESNDAQAENTITAMRKEIKLFVIAVMAPLVTKLVCFEANPAYTRRSPQPAPVSQAFWVKASIHTL
ncbi:Uncharacterised protein [Chlamydia trachomatis]|nr:Uncharacterised protein [Chlamydia trachomatis]